jgi:hypothetical protein
VPLRNASALDIVTLLNRLLADPGAAGAGPIDAQQRVTIMADARSNSVLGARRQSRPASRASGS